jgi:hypothetical protein
MQFVSRPFQTSEHGDILIELKKHQYKVTPYWADFIRWLSKRLYVYTEDNLNLIGVEDGVGPDDIECNVISF